MTTSLLLLLLSLLFSHSSANHQNNGTILNHHILNACKATRHPEPCELMLTQSGQIDPKASPKDIIRRALHVSDQKANSGQAMIKQILDKSAQDPNKTKAARTCLETMGYSFARSREAASALSRGRLRDARAWMSAALNLRHGCWGGLKYVNDTPLVAQTLTFFDKEVVVSISNALSMVRAMDAIGLDSTKWEPPKTERDGFWEPVVPGSGSGRLGFMFDLSTMKENVTICKEGCKHRTVQEAVDAAPENLRQGERYVIKIKEGVYDEIVRVAFLKRNLVFLGDGMGKTVITGSLNYGLQGINTFHTATVGILADGFMAYGITFQNKAGPGAQQAVAFRSDSDFSYIENCEFVGHQDTLYAHTLRQFYKNCRIIGHIDFIFGNSAALFENCTILLRPRMENPEKGGTSAITAQGRSDPVETTGLAFLGCNINGTEEFLNLYKSNPSIHKNYLGRPWKMFSKTVFINCTMGEVIHPEGWLPWDGDFALSTAYYGEYGNSGPGSDRSKRVPRSNAIAPEHVSTFSVQNFLQGDEWITKVAS